MNGITRRSSRQPLRSHLRWNLTWKSDLRRILPSSSPLQTDCKPRPSDVKGARPWTDGEHPVDLYQVGTFGLLAFQSSVAHPGSLPRVHPDTIDPDSSTAVDVVFPEEWAQSPLPIETFLHIQTWNARYPHFHRGMCIGIQCHICQCRWLPIHNRCTSPT